MYSPQIYSVMILGRLPNAYVREGIIRLRQRARKKARSLRRNEWRSQF